MRSAPLAIAALVAACSGESAPPNPMPKPIAAIERRIQSPFHGVAIAADGIYYDHKKLSTLADFDGKPRVDLVGTLMHARAAAGPLSPPGVSDPERLAMGVVVVPDSMVSPAMVGTMLSVVRLGGWSNVSLKQTRTDPEDPGQHDLESVCNLVPSGEDRAADPEDRPVMLSVLFTPGDVWVGLSRINEFQQIPPFVGGRPDWVKLEWTLKEHKMSAFFADRTDIELALEGTPPVTDLLTAIEIACKVGFTDVRLYDPASLAARPTL